MLDGILSLLSSVNEVRRSMSTAFWDSLMQCRTFWRLIVEAVLVEDQEGDPAETHMSLDHLSMRRKIFAPKASGA